MPALGDFKLPCTFGLVALYLHYRDIRFPYMTFSGSDKSHFRKYARRYPEINRLISIFGADTQPVQYLFRSGRCLFLHAVNSFEVEMCFHSIADISQVCSRCLHKHTVMASYKSFMPANCCVWPASAVTSGQVTGSVLIFRKSKQHKVSETSNFPRLRKFTGVSEAQRHHWRQEGRRGGGGRWKTANICVRVCLVPDPGSILRLPRPEATSTLIRGC